MRASISACVEAGALLAIGGCVPAPHMNTIAPEISGRIFAGQAPVANTTVHYRYKAPWEDGECLEPDTTVVTDRTGAFLFPEVREFRFFTFFGEPIYIYEICVDYDGGKSFLWRDISTHYVETPIELSCDMNRAIVSDRIRSRGRCEATWPTE